ncbi:MAG: cupin domain-containing protein [bacterium]
MPERQKATPTVRVDNQKTIVTEWRFAAGAETGWHRHELDYVVVPLTSGKLKLETNTGTQSSDLVIGVPYFREKGVEHNVINDNDYEFVFVETEFK